MYLSGDSRKILNSFERYNYAKNYWEELESFQTPRAGHFCWMNTKEKLLFIAGGKDSMIEKPLKSIEYYDIKTGYWNQIERKPKQINFKKRYWISGSTAPQL